MPPRQQRAPAVTVPTGTPIHKLAAELLIEIFLLVPNDTDSSRWHQTVPLRLSAVCRSWRRIAIGTPRLWLKLSFNKVLRSGSPPNGRGLAVVGRDLLRRSSPHKISIEFHPKLHTAAERRVVLALWSADRWRKMDLGVEVLPLLQDSPRRSLPRLRHLKISSLNGNSHISHPKIKFFAHAPRLNQVELDNLPNALGVVLPWTQLKTLDLFSFWPSTFHYFEILPRCTALVDLFLVVRAWREDDPSVPSETSPIKFPALRYLKLELSLESDWKDMAGTFDAFFLRVHAPQLLSLDLHCGGGGYNEDRVGLDGIGAFLGRSPLVDNITITQCDTLIRGNYLLEILDLVPSVRELRFIHCSEVVNDAVLERLTYRASDPKPAAPCLEVFEAISDCKGFDEDVALEMIASRWNIPSSAPVARWKRVFWAASPAELCHTEHFQKELRRFATEGLNVVVDFEGMRALGTIRVGDWGQRAAGEYGVGRASDGDRRASARAREEAAKHDITTPRILGPSLGSGQAAAGSRGRRGPTTIRIPLYHIGWHEGWWIAPASGSGRRNKVRLALSPPRRCILRLLELLAGRQERSSSVQYPGDSRHESDVCAATRPSFSMIPLPAAHACTRTESDRSMSDETSREDRHDSHHRPSKATMLPSIPPAQFHARALNVGRQNKAARAVEPAAALADAEQQITRVLERPLFGGIE
uniref:F-box domain-containing protein n=1 Tax=Mycena chlorophos TaxID=658473 RepID=A0ABQ0LAT3_MYCCL|nr:predicted protein [Mycena chlorophos]